MSQNILFKSKSTKKVNSEKRSTLDAIHKEQLLKIDERKEECDALLHKIQTLENEMKNMAGPDRYIMENNIDKLRWELDNVMKKSDIVNYYLDTGDLLFNYYDLQDKISSQAAWRDKHAADYFSPENSAARSKYLRPGSIFAALDEAAAAEKQLQPRPTEQPQEHIQTLAKHTKNRDKIFDTYLQIIDPEQASSIGCSAYGEMDGWAECSRCGSDMMFCMNEAFITCPKCGFQDHILIDSDKPSYKDPPREICYYAYKRINHFNEWLAQFQAKESTEIPQEVYDSILIELKKERISNMSSLKSSKIREILKKLKFTKYYEHIPHILNRLNGQTAPVMSRENEEKLRAMFREIQQSFQKHCPTDRSNFLSYSYVLYKFCELLELDEFLPCFPLLKNRDKLYSQDCIWKLICDDMKWEFIRTI
jgi:DNA-directed RNA polymerase subunit RPC12/RpoP